MKMHPDEARTIDQLDYLALLQVMQAEAESVSIKV